MRIIQREMKISHWLKKYSVKEELTLIYTDHSSVSEGYLPPGKQRFFDKVFDMERVSCHKPSKRTHLKRACA